VFGLARLSPARRRCRAVLPGISSHVRPILLRIKACIFAENGLSDAGYVVAVPARSPRPACPARPRAACCRPQGRELCAHRHHQCISRLRGLFVLFYYLGFPIITSNLISWLVAATGSYVMNSMTTFAVESGRKLRLKSCASFLLAQVAGLVANTATVLIVSATIPLAWRTAFGAEAPLALGRHAIDPVLIGKVLAIGASFLVNFSLSRSVVFRRREPSATH